MSDYDVEPDDGDNASPNPYDGTWDEVLPIEEEEPADQVPEDGL